MSVDAIRRLWHRVQALVARGRLPLIDDSGPVQLAQARIIGDEVKDQIPRMAEYGFVSSPPENSDAIILFMAGERSMGVIIATNNQTFRMRNLATGEVAIHDNKGRFVLLGAAGIHVQGNADPVLVETTGTITANAGGDIDATSTGGGINLTAATTIHLQADFIHMQAASIAMEAPGVGITATTVGITAATTLTGATAINGTTTIAGDTDITGGLTNNGHNAGSGHEHLPGTFKAGTTSITGVSGVVTP
jgi:phage baseplate assembly protein V